MASGVGWLGGDWVYFTLRCYLGFAAGLEVIGSLFGFNKGRGDGSLFQAILCLYRIALGLG